MGGRWEKFGEGGSTWAAVFGPSEERGEHADGNIEAFAASPNEAVAQAVKSLESIMHRVKAVNMSF